jgi:hypothetical protein
MGARSGTTDGGATKGTTLINTSHSTSLIRTRSNRPRATGVEDLENPYCNRHWTPGTRPAKIPAMLKIVSIKAPMQPVHREFSQGEPDDFAFFADGTRQTRVLSYYRFREAFSW